MQFTLQQGNNALTKPLRIIHKLWENLPIFVKNHPPIKILMLKYLFFPSTITILLGSASSVAAQKTTKPNLKFIDDIEVGIGNAPTETMATTKGSKAEVSTPVVIEKRSISPNDINYVEKASTLQLKYALLLNIDVEQVENQPLFTLIDEWFGTRYRYGGSTKSGIDCSAFTQTLYSGIYGINLPRTAKDQYKIARQISRTEVKEGDLVFFNTTGGVSHVGYYLQNNKFVHAASSGGVMISDLYDDYWVRRFIGVGRIEGINTSPLFSQP